ncbi:hypothetical protein Tco_1374724, partial [Tanacetum coccineum]
AGDFFHHAQSNATAQHIEFEEHRLAEGSMDSPLLLEQVLVFCLALYVGISYSINSIALSENILTPSLMFVGDDYRVVKASKVGIYDGGGGGSDDGGRRLDGGCRRLGWWPPTDGMVVAAEMRWWWEVGVIGFVLEEKIRKCKK